MMHRCSRVVLALGLGILPLQATAQDLPTAGGEVDSFPRVSAGALIPLGSPAESRLRLDQILGRDSTPGFLLRSPSTLTPPPAGSGVRFQAIFAGAESAWNSSLPFSSNDGSLWAGRGLNLRVAAGFRVEAGPLSLIVAPEISYQQNLDYQFLPYNRTVDASRDLFSSPWYDRPESIDLPSRFGSRSFGGATMGQSSLTLSLGPVALGAATENLWWGPGIRNAILMSDNAAGIPHLFLRASRPLDTPMGTIDGRWLLGRLDESDYFDNIAANDTRSLSALALTLSPAFDRNLTVGFARAVYAPTSSNDVTVDAAFDVFRSVGRPNAGVRSDLLREPGPDQLFSFFGRWIFPRAGFEAYGEWARYEQPQSLRDLLVLPQHSQGYTLGIQWARPVSDSGVVRLHGEVTYLEPSSSYWQRNEIGWYTSRPVKQGYTHRGQLIGAGIGPGGSTQFAGADYLIGRTTQVGLFGGRIRWNNQAFYKSVRPFYAHDVSLFLGARGSRRVGLMDISVELSTEGRMNYLFQSPSPDWDAQEAVDIRNHSLRISVTPRLD